MPNLGSKRWSMGFGSPPTVRPRVNSDRMIVLRKGWKRRGGDAEAMRVNVYYKKLLEAIVHRVLFC